MSDSTGILRKMPAVTDNECQYHLPIGDEKIPLNQYLEREITLNYTGNIFCVQCGRKTSKSFQQGYCYPCFQRLQECGCMVKPELCKIYQGVCKEDDWAHQQCFGEHIIYLANSSGLKVGITRACNVPSRWIDQGASQALPIMKVANRYQSGIVEVCFKQFVADKTNWRAMLKGTPEPINLIEQRDALMAKAEQDLSDIEQKYPGEIVRLDESIVTLSYPVINYPEKIKSLNFDKAPLVGGTLLGIKGQYLIFDTGVINIRKFSGYEVNVNLS